MIKRRLRISNKDRKNIDKDKDKALGYRRRNADSVLVVDENDSGMEHEEKTRRNNFCTYSSIFV